MKSYTPYTIRDTDPYLPCSKINIGVCLRSQETCISQKEMHPVRYKYPSPIITASKSKSNLTPSHVFFTGALSVTLCDTPLYADQKGLT